MDRQKLRNIRLYGPLGDRFGRVHRLAVSSTAEAIRALSAIVPGFQDELLGSHERGVGYAVFVGKTNIQGEGRALREQLHAPVGDDDIRIAPALMGAKRGGLGQLLLGVVIVVASVVTWGVAGIAAGGIAATVAGTGAAMALGGISQLISPQQKGTATSDSAANKASYNFNGPVNTTAQGNPVPILYGRIFIGPAVVSAGVYSEDQA